ncbi:PRD domain-containing protein [Pectobacterium aroidearum]|uniref:BglG family transcription antiterminator LicT n=1 Tax=Pectobacterium aroidearum TaxID=1201031 RepID=UPI0015F608A4|nr:PRD domain-containing protein [Pectobacterium aroidearum]MBA5601314.1 PRD domain-containing protein [Pectobacterium aroidearum]
MTFYIKQILNNNVVSATDPLGNELILTGRGLGFEAHVGDEISENKVEKTFHLHDDKIYSRFMVLLNEVPMEIIQLTDDIVHLAQNSLNYKISEGLYVSLSDHLHYAIERHKQGLEITNPLEWEVRHFYKDEYTVALQALAIIASRSGVLLPNAEACSIALHIVNAGMKNADGQVTEITKLIYQIQNIVKYWYGVTIDEKSINYQRFITHIKFFAQRVLRKTELNDDVDDLFTLIKKKHEKTVNCVNAIGDFIKKNYQYQMTDAEKLYLTVHIENMMQRQKNSI